MGSEEKNNSFKGDRKVGESILSKPEKWFKNKFIDFIPKNIETYHLTMMTLLWSILNIFFFYLAKMNLKWLLFISILIILQYLTDLFDGAIGRKRDTGLIKWGFFMDHFLDYIFLCSLLIGYYIISPIQLGIYFMFLLSILGGFMINSFLSFASTSEFEIYFYGFGPTEFRIVLIIINTSIMITGVNCFKYTMPVICLVCASSLTYLIYKSHKKLWAIDMENKQI